MPEENVRKMLLDYCRPHSPESILKEVIVLGPYPTQDFFKIIVDKLAPKKVTLAVDDGWPSDQLEKIERLLDETEISYDCLPIRPADANGLVHAKIYFFVWKIENTWAYYLAWGSANASIQALDYHAECISVASLNDLSLESSDRIKSYFKALKKKQPCPTQCLVPLSSGIWILLPAIVHANTKAPSFDNWLRSGRLCHKYIPDPSFGKLTISLRHQFPRVIHEKIANTHGFARDSRKNQLQKKYAGAQRKLPTARPRWRSKYFLDTLYGHWTNKDCYAAERNGDLHDRNKKVIRFEAPHRKQRRMVITEISQATPKVHNRWIREVMDSLEAVCQELRDQEGDPARFFHVVDDEVDVDRYRLQHERKLNLDCQKANLSSFANRFESGYEFAPVYVPDSHFARFATTWCESLLRELQSNPPQNLIAHALWQNMADYDIDIQDVDSGEELYGILSSKWLQIKDIMNGYYRL